MVRWPMTKTERQKIQTSETPNQHIASEEVRTEKNCVFDTRRLDITYDLSVNLCVVLLDFSARGRIYGESISFSHRH